MRILLTILVLLAIAAGILAGLHLRETADSGETGAAVKVSATSSGESRSSTATRRVNAKSFWYRADGRPVRFLATYPAGTFTDSSLGERTGQKLSFFVPYNIVQPHRESDAYLLANKMSVELGWAPAYSGVFWMTRQGVDLRRFNKKESLQDASNETGEVSFDFPIRFYSTLGDLKKDLEGDASAPDPLGMIENPKEVASKFMKWPLLESSKVVINGRETRAYKVCLVGMQSSEDDADSGVSLQGAVAKSTHLPADTAPAVNAEELDAAVAAVLPSLFRLDLCFVMDMTSSMRPYHMSFRENIQRIVTELRTKYPELDMQIGWSAYQDQLEGKENYVARYFGAFLSNENFDQLPNLRQAVASTELLAVSSIDHEECVYWGVHNAIQKFPWRSGAERVVVVCGDAPNHEPGASKNVGGFSSQDIVDQLDNLEIRPFAIHATNIHGLNFQRQFQFITSAASRTGGRAFPVSDANGFVASLTDFMSTKGQRVYEGGKTVQGVFAAGDRPNSRRIQDIDEDKKAMMIEILKDRPQGKLGPEFNTIIKVLEGDTLVDRKVSVAVHAAWVPESIDGVSITETYELVSKTEVKRLQDYLRELQELGRPDTAELLSLGRYAQVFGEQAELTKWLESEDATEPLSRYMQQQHHIVTRTGLFQLTKEHFRSMSSKERLELLNLAEKYDDYLQDIRTDDDFWQRIGEVDFVWLPSRDLP